MYMKPCNEDIKIGCGITVKIRRGELMIPIVYMTAEHIDLIKLHPDQLRRLADAINEVIDEQNKMSSVQPMIYDY